MSKELLQRIKIGALELSLVLFTRRFAALDHSITLSPGKNSSVWLIAHKEWRLHLQLI
jgi:hypothetical protein